MTDLPAGDHSLAIAPFGTEEFEWSTFDFSIEANKRYIIIASGLRDPSQYNSTINTEEQMAFRIQMVEVPLRENIETDEVFLVLDHGVSDLPNIRLIAPGVGDATAALPTGLPLDFMLIGGGVPAFDFPLVQVTDNTTTEIFGAYKLNFASRFGQAATILTSGFFSSEGNTDVDEPTFGTFIVPEEGGFFEALGDPDPPVPGTIDILHASPDPSLTEVDVYVNGEKAISNLGYLQASGRVDIPAGLNRLAISPVGEQVDTNWSATEILIDSDINPNTLLIEGFNYTAGVNGLRDPMTVPNSTNEITFSLVQTDARLSSVDSANTDILFLHAALDAPTIDLYVDGQFVPIIDDISFGMFSPTYVSLPADNIYQINITATR